MNIYDTWHGQFFSRSGGTHQFTFKLEKGADGPVASLFLNRATPDPRNGKFEVHFKAHAKVSEKNGCQFIALVAQDEEGQLFATILKAVEYRDTLIGSLVFNSVRTHEIDQEEVEWRRDLRQHHANGWQIWYSTFISPSGNTQWFTLHLNPDYTAARLEVEVLRSDNLKLNPSIRVHIEKSGPHVALLVKDDNPPHGIVAMILYPDSDDSSCLRGQTLWTSLTDGASAIVRVKQSREIIWTTLPSSDHPVANPL